MNLEFLPLSMFYAMEVLVALEYLHMLGDHLQSLKPNNVLDRSDSHIMLSDLNLSLISDPTVEFTNSFLDTTITSSMAVMNSKLLPRSCISISGCSSDEKYMVTLWKKNKKQQETLKG